MKILNPSTCDDILYIYLHNASFANQFCKRSAGMLSKRSSFVPEYGCNGVESG